MRNYTSGKKAAAIVIHQMFIIVMMSGIYASGYCIRNNNMEALNLFTAVMILGMIGGFVALAYITTVTGRKSEDDENIYYKAVDKVYSDIFILAFMFIIIGIINIVFNVKVKDFDFSSLMVAVCTITYIFDGIFLIFYNSIIRRIKGNILITNSVCYIVLNNLRKKNKESGYKFRTQKTREILRIQEAMEKIAKGELDTTLNLDEFHGQEREVAEAFNHIRDGLMESVNESLKNEKLKADLITNVSHDLKTPLTSIVNYVELLKRENLDDENARNYIRIIDEKSQRLKQLTEDLVEASKISSGNIELDIQKIDFIELLYQIGGEFNERFEKRDLTIVTKIPSGTMYIMADGRQMYRAIENLYTNAAKYAMQKTRVYVELKEENNEAVFTIKNVSNNHIQMDGDLDLTDRFVRGEKSRTTEGSGLGLSIAKNLTDMMGGSFKIKVDGDLFIATISFKMV